MKSSVRIKVFGSLAKAAGSPPDSSLIMELDGPTALADLIGRLPLEADGIQVAMVNSRAVGRGAVVQPGDRVALFPREYPFFVDWRDLRLGG